jgi:pimeloyl-ACP methyl ester carboxylesterase
MPTPAQIAANTWLPDPEMAVYAAEYGRTGFQAGLNWYRARTTPGETAEQEVFAGRRIEVPAAFIAGRSDWGIYQIPGAIERMRVACPRMGEPVLIPGAGHWVQQEQPEAVVAALLAFLGN